MAIEARHLDKLCLQIDCLKLCACTSMPREDIPCTVDLSRRILSAIMGKQNYHGEITFDDHVK